MPRVSKGKRPATKSKYPARRKAGLKFAGKKRLTPLRTEKIKIRKAIEARLGYPIARLSTSGKNPRTHSVKKRVTIYEKGETKFVTKQVWMKGHMGRNMWGETHWIPEGEVTRRVEESTRGKAIGEKLIVKKHRKKGGGGGKSSSSGGERVSHRTGTSQARKSAAKAARVGGKTGGRPKRNTKKKKKKK